VTSCRGKLEAVITGFPTLIERRILVQPVPAVDRFFSSLPEAEPCYSVVGPHGSWGLDWSETLWSRRRKRWLVACRPSDDCDWSGDRTIVIRQRTTLVYVLSDISSAVTLFLCVEVDRCLGDGAADRHESLRDA